MQPSSKEGGVSLGLDYHGTPAEQLEKLFKDCGVSPDKVGHQSEGTNYRCTSSCANSRMRSMPTNCSSGSSPRSIMYDTPSTNTLSGNVSVVPYGALISAYKELYESRTINPRSVIFLPLVYIVFSISTRVAPDEWGLSEEDKRTASLRFYWNCGCGLVLNLRKPKTPSSLLKPSKRRPSSLSKLRFLYVVMIAALTSDRFVSGIDV